MLNIVMEEILNFSDFIKLSFRMGKETRNKEQINKGIKCWEETKIRK